MPTPVLAAIQKYTTRGTTKIYWVPVIAAANRVPTRAELTAGTDLSPQIADGSGWATSSKQIPTPNIDTRYTPTISGVIESEDSSLTYYMDREGVDARQLMPRDEEGFIVVLDGGDVAANKADVYPVQVTSVSKKRSFSGNEADVLVISYAITDEPAENVAVPAAA